MWSARTPHSAVYFGNNQWYSATLYMYASIWSPNIKQGGENKNFNDQNAENTIYAHIIQMTLH